MYNDFTTTLEDTYSFRMPVFRIQEKVRWTKGQTKRIIIFFILRGGLIRNRNML
jgi:cytochrome c oxidase subunit IV